jgi:hypothetical protein
MGATYVFLPPLKKPTGGLIVLHRVAAHLRAAGREVRLAPREAGSWRPDISGGAPETAWSELALGPGDVWLVPEGWPGALAPGLKSGAECVIYCQNWAYLFSSLPEGVSLADLNVRFLAVSEPVALYIRETLGREAPVLGPGIDLELFCAPDEKPAPAGGPVTVAYMPRKNSALAARIREACDAKAAAGTGPRIIWEEIRDLPPQGVAERLKRSHIFLATGFPEGCPLPPLEAMACGCFVVGFAGFGGFDYMRNVSGAPRPAYEPWWELRRTPWGGNGLYAADADVLGAAELLGAAVRWAAEGDERYARAVSEAAKTARAYGLEAQRQNVLDVWDGLEKA